MRAAVVCHVRNEAHVIAGWLGHHIGLGFDRIFVFDDFSTDNTRDILTTAQHACPDVVAWFPAFIDPDHRVRQRMSYEAALTACVREGIEWLLAVDADEFAVSVTGEGIRPFLERMDARAAIALFWAFYGSSGHVLQPPGLVTENFLLRGPKTFHASRHTKSLVRVPCVQGVVNAHTFSLDQRDFPYYDAADRKIQWHAPDVLFAPWRLNHYWCQSKERFALKLARSRAAHGFTERSEADFAEYDLNDTPDFTALAYSDRIRSGMAILGLGDAVRPGAVVYEPVPAAA